MNTIRRRITSLQQWRATALLALVALLAACASAPTQRSAAEADAVSSAANDNLNATLWMQASAEYRAAVSGSYTLARQQLDAALADPAGMRCRRLSAPPSRGAVSRACRRRSLPTPTKP